MKRFAAFILSLLFLTASSGMTVNMHYCMGKLRSVQVQSWGGKACGCGRMAAKSKKCCRTEQARVKLADVQQALAFTYEQPVLSPAVVPCTYTVIAPVRTSSQVGGSFLFLPPPRSRSLYLQNCVFRI